MPRPFSGKSHVGERREIRPNGDIYVYERITAYDQNTRKTHTVEESLKGKIKAGEAELVPTRPKLSKGEKSQTIAVRIHTGTTELLEWAGRASGIDNDIRMAFSEGDTLKIESIARYWVATDGNSLPRLESWQSMHNLPYSQGISEDVYSDLFKSIGHNEDGIQKYFKGRAARLDKNPVIALDTTTVSTYSENQIEARHGFNKEHDGLPIIKLVTSYSAKDQEPIAYAKQPGNIPDIISLDNALSQLQALGIIKPLTVTDGGFCSERNLTEYAMRNMKFLTIMDATADWIRNIIDGLLDQLQNMSAVCPFDLSIRGATTTVMHEFEYLRRRSRNGKEVGDSITFNRRLYIYVFYSEKRKVKRTEDFTGELLLLKKQLEEGQTEFTEAAEKKTKKYLHQSRIGRGGALKVTFNDEAIQQAMKYFGYFVLISNQALELFKALEYYRLREKVEEFFSDDKGSFDGRKPRVWYPDNLRGRQFVQFVGLGYHCFIAKKIKDVRRKLEQKVENEKEREMKIRKKLAKWIDNHSFAQIMDWFDCIETTKVTTETVRIRWSTEMVAQDKLFLKMLGVIKD